MKDQEDYVGVLNVLLLPSGGPGEDHIEQEDPATLPASFSPAPQSCNWLHTSVVTTEFWLTADGATIALSVSTRVS